MAKITQYSLYPMYREGVLKHYKHNNYHVMVVEIPTTKVICEVNVIIPVTYSESIRSIWW